MQQRYYDPLAARFMSVDPVTTDANTGGMFNRYVYGNNNPYRFTDPDGRVSWDDASSWVHGALGAASFCPSACGSAFSFVDAGVHLAEGNKTEAAIAGGAGLIGLVSDAGAVKLGAKLVQEGAAAAKGGIGPVLKGEAGVARSIAAAEARGETVLGKEITMQTAGGRTRPDLLVRDAQGNLKFIESKCGPGACLNPNQAGRFPELQQSGGIPRGGNAAGAGLTPGRPIGPTPVQVDYWP